MHMMLVISVGGDRQQPLLPLRVQKLLNVAFNASPPNVGYAPACLLRGRLALTARARHLGLAIWSIMIRKVPLMAGFFGEAASTSSSPCGFAASQRNTT
jgi:hypothetical protein